MFLFACIITPFALWWVYWYQPRNDVTRLLEGHNTMRISSLVITGQGGRYVLSDPLGLQYLTDAFRTAVKEGYTTNHVGRSYDADIALGSGRKVLIGIQVPKHEAGMTISFPLDGLDDPIYYWVPLAEPIPEVVSIVLHQLK
jgi:hypothetical protein